MEIYENPLYVSRVGGYGNNIFVDNNERYEVFCNDVSKSSTKDQEKINRILDKVGPKRLRSEQCFYPESKKRFLTTYRG